MNDNRLVFYNCFLSVDYCFFVCLSTFDIKKIRFSMSLELLIIESIIINLLQEVVSCNETCCNDIA